MQTKWILILLVILALGAGGYILAAHLSGGALPTFGLEIGGERQVVRQKTLQFWENLKFKDLKRATAMLGQEVSDPAPILQFLERTFHTEPESLDITEYSVVSAELDSTGRRVRIKASVSANQLATRKPIRVEVMHFFYQSPKGDWWLDLSNSL